VISDKRTFPTVNAAKRKKSTMNVRTAILYRKGLAALLDESGLAALGPTQPSYLTASAPASAVPPRMLCSVCGYKGAYRCKKCGMSYCDLRCSQVHDETRCERRVV
jgi:zinc finger HIT domain-containing protein 1